MTEKKSQSISGLEKKDKNVKKNIKEDSLESMLEEQLRNQVRSDYRRSLGNEYRRRFME
ncbi:hypothetical protein [Methanosarcina sp.]|uniref:hypothetical protein n=1 Tax=Methanosarcina sp. TaxID=2213 RepID=UPI002988CF75|nr:hypothetical protein [Methanosarcina sp.]MDW5551167.1 hypothetical protein [Methanosarcina sp.]MDW5552802.1 hypothetical protein [Methanosarcina sp.]MDW5558183.1 hypothetical protein [Methanosarcina sp.]